MTGRDKAGSPEIAAGGVAPATITGREAVRKAYWATTFRALGDVLHLVQDMAQPQHTRNDPHAGKFPQPLTGFSSVYEKYIDARATGKREFSIDGEKIEPVALSVDLQRDYPLPTFNRYSDYWSTREGVVNGKGLADYSNRGFFTLGTNLGENSYSRPSNDRNDYTLELASVDYVEWEPFDVLYLRGTAQRVRGGALCRGSVFGFNTIKLKLRNSTPRQVVGSAAYPQPMSGGTLVAVVKYRRNACYQPDLSGEFDDAGNNWSGCTDARTPVEEIAVSAPLQDVQVGEVNSPFTFDFSADPIPVNATDVFLQVVYRGPLGEEADAVAVATRDIGEPTFLSLLNATDYFLLHGAFYTPDTILTTPSLFSQIDADGNGSYDPLLDINIDPIDLTYNLGFGGGFLVNVTLPPARFCRVAILSDLPAITLNQQKVTFGYSTTLNAAAKVFQLNPETGITDTTPVYRFRGFYRNLVFPDWKFEGAEVNGDTSVMTDLPDVAPYPVTINF